MSISSRVLTVIGEFKPFGLVSEELDGEDGGDFSTRGEFSYFLFDPELLKVALPATRDFTDPVASFDGGDHEIFCRGNRIIWSMGSHMYRRYSCPNPVIMVCWCRLDASCDAFLCVLQVDTLSLYNASGEVACIPLQYPVASIWSLPFGLLLQKSADGDRPISSNSLLNARDLSRYNKAQVLNRHTSCVNWTIGDEAIASSHLILKHPFEGPQVVHIEEREHLNVMKDFQENTIWTTSVVPLMASYHKGKLHHSLWQVDRVPISDVLSPNSNVKSVPNEHLAWRICLRRIWEGKFSQTAACKVFLATDTNEMPILCFLLKEQKLLVVRLQIHDGTDEYLLDGRPDLSWKIPAVDAAPVIVTRPSFKVGDLPFTDIVVLDSENVLFLYSGKECLCKYVFPLSFWNGMDSEPSETCNVLKISALSDSVEGRINVTLSTGQTFRCSFRRFSSSSLANDCISAMSEGLSSSLYSHFTHLLWNENYPSNMSSASPHVDSDWGSFTGVVRKICDQYTGEPAKCSPQAPETAWAFLTSCKFHSCYGKYASVAYSSYANGFLSRSSGGTPASFGDEPCQESSFLKQILEETLDSLHAFYENLKLDVLRKRDVELLVVLLFKIAHSLGESGFMDYYSREFPTVSLELGFFKSIPSPREPPILCRWFENSLRNGFQAANIHDLPPLLQMGKVSVLNLSRKVVCFYSLLLGAERIGRQLSSGVYFVIARGSAKSKEELAILAMVAERFGRYQLNQLPVGVSLPLYHALDRCRESPPMDWPEAAYVLVGREDLAMACSRSLSETKLSGSQNSTDLLSVSVPYALHLQSVTLPSTVSDGMKSDLNPKDLDVHDKFVDDGMEHILNSTTQLRFGRDLRLNEVRRLLCSVRPVPVQTSTSPSASDQDFQQHQLWNLAQRTTSLPFGRGAFTLSTTYTLLTDAISFPDLVLAGWLPSQQNATVNLDPNVRNVSELRTWPEFHNGVAAGLRLAPFQGQISRAWMLYNKPGTPSVMHAGLILAFGLHKHLEVLTIVDAYNYLAQKHDFTTLGTLLGWAACYRGTMRPEVSKMLYIHVPSRHSSFHDFELPTVVQSAALMGIGLLYEGTAQPSTMKFLLSEIGRRSTGDNVLEREGYAVAAGAALGLVALGCGKHAFGSMNNFVELLYQFLGGREFCNGNFLGKAGQAFDEQMGGSGQIIDRVQFNADVTSPAAAIALSLIFLKTESEVIASRICVPVTQFDLQYVRPDFIMLRIIARNLIMWSRIRPSGDWIDSQIPEIVKARILRASVGNDDEFDAETLFQAFVNIISGACISLGLKYAGTKNADAQELLFYYAQYFLNEIKQVSVSPENSLPKGLSQYVDRGTLEICLHLIVLSLSVVMAGSGHLQTFRLLRYLRGRTSPEGQISYGIQMIVSLAIGFLFLGAGTQTFSTGNIAVAALLLTLYPRLPTGPNDNRCYLQAFRHLYVLAVESRWIQTVDVDTGLPAYAPLEVTVTETEDHAETSFYDVSPCILPERCVLKSVRVCGPRYWPQVIQLVPEDEPWWKPGKDDPFNAGILYIKRKVGCCSYVDDPIGCQSLLSRLMSKVSDDSYLKNAASSLVRKGIRRFSRFDELVGTYSADPSMIAFAQLCSFSTSSYSVDADFQEFSSSVLFECVSKDRPALLQVYLSLYTLIGMMWDHVKSSQIVFHDSLFLSSLKLVTAYNDALINGNLLGGGIVRTSFIESIRRRVEDIFFSSETLKGDFHDYLNEGKQRFRPRSGYEADKMVLSWYLQWFSVPPPYVVASVLKKINGKIPANSVVVLPILHKMMPGTHIRALAEIDAFRSYSDSMTEA